MEPLVVGVHRHFERARAMSVNRYYARAGGDATAIAQVASLLVMRWDPEGELVAPDSTCDPRAHAVTVLGILATGPDTARVMRYLREAEERAWGEPRTTGPERHAIARDALVVLREAAERMAAAQGTR